jgi:hypothetical protein
MFFPLREKAWRAPRLEMRLAEADFEWRQNRRTAAER